MDNTETNYLRIEQLKVQYDKDSILEKFDLELEEGKLYVILGPSGCGKSTLLSAISGLKKPSSGKISFLNNIFFDKSKGINIPVEKRNIGFVFQSYALWPHMTVFQNVAYPLITRKVKKIEIKNRVEHMLKSTGLEKYGNRYPNDLSGGEKQRVALIRSLIYEPNLLLLDEPLANLDTALKTKISQEIRTMQRKYNITTIYVTHDQNEAFQIADEILVMKGGEIMQKGSPQTLYNHSSNSFVAEFVGKNNLFHKHDFHTHFICNKKFDKCNNYSKEKKHKWISIRPEDVEIVRINDKQLREIKEEDVYTGILNKIEFKGAITEYSIQYKETNLISVSSQYYHVQIGDRVSFVLNRYNVIAD